MANISFFFPDKEKGFALGLNAAGGNIGVSTVQLLVPIVIGYAILPGQRTRAATPRERRLALDAADHRRGDRRLRCS